MRAFLMVRPQQILSKVSAKYSPGVADVIDSMKTSIEQKRNKYVREHP